MDATGALSNTDDIKAPAGRGVKINDMNVTGPATLTPDGVGGYSGALESTTASITDGTTTITNSTATNVTISNFKITEVEASSGGLTVNGAAISDGHNGVTVNEADKTYTVAQTQGQKVTDSGGTDYSVGPATTTLDESGQIIKVVLPDSTGSAYIDGVLHTGPMTIERDPNSNTDTYIVPEPNVVKDIQGARYTGYAVVTVPKNGGNTTAVLGGDGGDGGAITDKDGNGETFTGYGSFTLTGNDVTAVTLTGGQTVTVNGATYTGPGSLTVNDDDSVTATMDQNGTITDKDGYTYTYSGSATGQPVTVGADGAFGFPITLANGQERLEYEGVTYVGPATLNKAGNAVTAALTGGSATGTNVAVSGTATATVTGGHIGTVELTGSATAVINQATWTSVDGVSVTVAGDGTAQADITDGERVQGANGYVINSAADVTVGPDGNIRSATLGQGGQAVILGVTYDTPGTHTFNPAPGGGGTMTGRQYIFDNGESGTVEGKAEGAATDDVTYTGYAEVTVDDTTDTQTAHLGKAVAGTQASPNEGKLEEGGTSPNTYEGVGTVTLVNAVVTTIALTGGEHMDITTAGGAARYDGPGSLTVTGSDVTVTLTGGSVTDVNGVIYRGATAQTLKNSALQFPLTLAAGDSAVINGLTYAGPAVLNKDAQGGITAALTGGSVSGTGVPTVSGSATVTVSSGGKITGVSVAASQNATVGSLSFVGQAAVTVDAATGGVTGVTLTGAGSKATDANSDVVEGPASNISVTSEQFTQVTVDAGANTKVNGAAYAGAITVALTPEGVATSTITTGQRITGANGYVVNSAANVTVNKYGNIISAILGADGTAVIEGETYNGPGEFTFDNTQPTPPDPGGDLTGRFYLIPNNGDRVIDGVGYNGYAEVTVDDTTGDRIHTVKLGVVEQGTEPNPDHGTVRDKGGATVNGAGTVTVNGSTGMVTGITLEQGQSVTITMNGQNATYAGPGNLMVSGATVTATMGPGGSITDGRGIAFTGTTAKTVTNGALTLPLAFARGEEVDFHGASYGGPGTLNLVGATDGTVTVDLQANGSAVDSDGNAVVAGPGLVHANGSGQITLVDADRGDNTQVNGATYTGDISVTVSDVGQAMSDVQNGERVTDVDNNWVADDATDIVVSPAGRIVSFKLGPNGKASIGGKEVGGPGDFIVDGGELTGVTIIPSGEEDDIGGAHYTGYAVIELKPNGTRVVTLGAPDEDNGSILPDSSKNHFTGPGSFEVAATGAVTNIVLTDGQQIDITLKNGEKATYTGPGVLGVEENQDGALITATMGQGGSIRDVNNITYTGTAEMDLQNNALPNVFPLLAGETVAIGGTLYEGPGTVTRDSGTGTVTAVMTGTGSEITGNGNPPVMGPVTVKANDQGKITEIEVAAGSAANVDGVDYTGQATLTVNTAGEVSVAVLGPGGQFTSPEGTTYSGEATVTAVAGGGYTAELRAAGRVADPTGDWVSGPAGSVTVKADGNISAVTVNANDNTRVNGATYSSTGGSISVTVTTDGEASSNLTTGQQITGSNGYVVNNARNVRVNKDGNIIYAELLAGGFAEIEENGVRNVYDYPGKFTFDVTEAPDPTDPDANPLEGREYEVPQGQNATIDGLRYDGYAKITVDDSQADKPHTAEVGLSGDAAASGVTDSAAKYSGPAKFTASGRTGQVTGITLDSARRSTTVTYTGSQNEAAFTGPGDLVVAGTTITATMGGGHVIDANGMKFTSTRSVTLTEGVLPNPLNMTGTDEAEFKGVTYTGAMTLNNNSGAITATLTGGTLTKGGLTITGEATVTVDNTGKITKIELSGAQTATINGDSYTGPATVTLTDDVITRVQLTAATSAATVAKVTYTGQADVTVNADGTSEATLQADAKADDVNSKPGVEGAATVRVDKDGQIIEVTVAAGATTKINGASYENKATTDITVKLDPSGEADSALAADQKITDTHNPPNSVTGPAASVTVDPEGRIRYVKLDEGSGGEAEIGGQTYPDPADLVIDPGGNVVSGRIVIPSGEDQTHGSATYYGYAVLEGEVAKGFSVTLGKPREDNGQVVDANKAVYTGPATIVTDGSGIVTEVTVGDGDSITVTSPEQTSTATYTGPARLTPSADGTEITAVLSGGGKVADKNGVTFTGAPTGSTVKLTNGALPNPIILKEGEKAAINGVTYEGPGTVTWDASGVTAEMTGAASKVTGNGNPDISGHAKVTVNATGKVTQIEVPDNQTATVNGTTYTGQATLTVDPTNGSITQTVLNTANGRVTLGNIIYTGPDTTIRPDGTADLGSGATATETANTGGYNNQVTGPAKVTANNGEIIQVEVTGTDSAQINGATYASVNGITVTLEDDGTAKADLDTGESVTGSNGYVINSATDVTVGPDGNIRSANLRDDGTAVINGETYDGDGYFEFDPAPGTGELTQRYYVVDNTETRDDLITGTSVKGYAEVTVLGDITKSLSIVLGKVVTGSKDGTPNQTAPVPGQVTDANGVMYNGTVSELVMEAGGAVSGVTLASGDTVDIASADYTGAGTLTVNGQTVTARFQTRGAIVDAKGTEYTGAGPVDVVNGELKLPLALQSGETLKYQGVTYTGPAAFSSGTGWDDLTVQLTGGSTANAAPEVENNATLTVVGGAITGIVVGATETSTIDGNPYTGPATVTVTGGKISKVELTDDNSVAKVSGVTYTGQVTVTVDTVHDTSTAVLKDTAAKANDANNKPGVVGPATVKADAAGEITKVTVAAGATTTINGASYENKAATDITVNLDASGAAGVTLATGQRITDTNSHWVENAAEVRVDSEGRIRSVNMDLNSNKQKDANEDGSAHFQTQDYSAPSQFLVDEQGNVTEGVIFIPTGQQQEHNGATYTGYAVLEGSTAAGYTAVLGMPGESDGSVVDTSGVTYTGPATTVADTTGKVTEITVGNGVTITATYRDTGGDQIQVEYTGPASVTVTAPGTVTADLTGGGSVKDKNGVEFVGAPSGASTADLTDGVLTYPITLQAGEKAVINGVTYEGPGTVTYNSGTQAVTADINGGSVTGNGNPGISGTVDVTVNENGKITQIEVPDGETATVNGITYTGQATLTVDPAGGSITQTVLGDNGQVTLDNTTYHGPATVTPATTGGYTAQVQATGWLKDPTGDQVDGPAVSVTVKAGGNISAVTVKANDKTKINGAEYSGDIDVTMTDEGIATSNLDANEQVTGRNGYVVSNAQDVTVSAQGNIIYVKLLDGGTANIKGDTYTGPGEFTFDDEPAQTPTDPDANPLEGRTYVVPNGENQTIDGITYTGYAEVTVDDKQTNKPHQALVGVVGTGSEPAPEAGSVRDGNATYTGPAKFTADGASQAVKSIELTARQTITTTYNTDIATYAGPGSLAVNGNVITATMGGGHVTDANGMKFTSTHPVELTAGKLPASLNMQAGDKAEFKGVTYEGAMTLANSGNAITATLTGGTLTKGTLAITGNATVTVDADGKITEIVADDGKQAVINGVTYTGPATVTLTDDVITQVALTGAASAATVAQVAYTGQVTVTVNNDGTSKAALQANAKADDVNGKPGVVGEATVDVDANGQITKVTVAAGKTITINGAEYENGSGTTAIDVSLYPDGTADSVLDTDHRITGTNNVEVKNKATHVTVDPEGRITYIKIIGDGEATDSEGKTHKAPNELFIDEDGKVTGGHIVIESGDQQTHGSATYRGYAVLVGDSATGFDVTLGKPGEDDGWILDASGATYTGPAVMQTDGSGRVTEIEVGDGVTISVTDAGGNRAEYTGPAKLTVDAANKTVTADLNGGKVKDKNGVEYVGVSGRTITVTEGALPDIFDLVVNESVTIAGARYEGTATVARNSDNSSTGTPLKAPGGKLTDVDGSTVTAGTDPAPVEVDSDGRLVRANLGTDGEAVTGGTVYTAPAVVVRDTDPDNPGGYEIHVGGGGTVTDPATGDTVTGEAVVTVDKEGNIIDVALPDNTGSATIDGTDYTGPIAMEPDTAPDNPGGKVTGLGDGGTVTDPDGDSVTGPATVTTDQYGDIIHVALPDNTGSADIDGTDYTGPVIVKEDPDGGHESELGKPGQVTDTKGNEVTGPATVKVDENGVITEVILPPPGEGKGTIDGTDYTGPATVTPDPDPTNPGGKETDLGPGGTVTDPDTGTEVTGPAKVTTDENGEIIEVVLPDDGEAKLDDTEVTGPATVTPDPDPTNPGGSIIEVDDGGKVIDPDTDTEVTGPATVIVDKDGNITDIKLPEGGEATIGGETYTGPAELEIGPDGKVTVEYVIPSGEQRVINGAEYTGYAKVTIDPDTGNAKAEIGSDGQVKDNNGDIYSGANVELTPDGALIFPLILEQGETAVIDGATYTGPAVLNREGNDTINAELNGGTVVDKNGATYTGTETVKVIDGELSGTIRLGPGETIVIDGATYTGPAVLTMDPANNKVEAKLETGGKIEDKDGKTYSSTTPVTVTDGKLPQTRPPYYGGGGGGGGSYSVAIDNALNGSAAASQSRPVGGSVVIITVTPKDGFELNHLSITDKSGKPVTVVSAGNNKYSFVMPYTDVEIDPTFTRIINGWPFVDVPEDHWAYEAVYWGYWLGYVEGTSPTTYSPSSNLTREQMWMFLARMSDTSPASMEAARAWAMTSNVSDGTDAKRPITRQEMVTMLLRWSKLMGYGASGSASLDGYADKADVADWALEAMRWSVFNDIIVGTGPNTLDPADNAHRDQCAVVLLRFFQNVEKDQ